MPSGSIWSICGQLRDHPVLHHPLSEEAQSHATGSPSCTWASWMRWHLQRTRGLAGRGRPHADEFSSTMPAAPSIRRQLPRRIRRNAPRPAPWLANPMTATSIYPLTASSRRPSSSRFELRKLRHDFTELVTAPSSRAVAAHLRAIFSRSGDAHGQHALSGFHRSRHPAPKLLFCHILRHQRHLGARPRHCAEFLASPTPRAALVLGKGFSPVSALSPRLPWFTSRAAARKLNWSPLALLNVLVVVGACGDAVLDVSLIIAAS